MGLDIRGHNRGDCIFKIRRLVKFVATVDVIYSFICDFLGEIALNLLKLRFFGRCFDTRLM